MFSILDGNGNFRKGGGRKLNLTKMKRITNRSKLTFCVDFVRFLNFIIRKVERSNLATEE